MKLLKRSTREQKRGAKDDVWPLSMKNKAIVYMWHSVNCVILGA